MKGFIKILNDVGDNLRMIKKEIKNNSAKVLITSIPPPEELLLVDRIEIFLGKSSNFDYIEIIRNSRSLIKMDLSKFTDAVNAEYAMSHLVDRIHSEVNIYSKCHD